jgi:hypothetical protein
MAMGTVELWQVEPGDVIRFRGHWPEVLTIRAIYAADYETVLWAAPGAWGRMTLSSLTRVELVQRRDGQAAVTAGEPCHGE